MQLSRRKSFISIFDPCATVNSKKVYTPIPNDDNFGIVGCRYHIIFEIQDILPGKQQETHSWRFKFFLYSDFKFIEFLKEPISYKANESLTVEHFGDIRSREDNIELLVKWKGLELP